MEELALVALLLPPTNGSVMLSSAEQPENTDEPISVTLSGIVILVSDEQPQNAYSPIEVMPSGMEMLVSDEQP